MMNIYGAEHHLLVLSDTIDADFHQHTFVQVTIALRSAFEIEIGGRRLDCAGIAIDSNVGHRLDGRGEPLLLLLMDRTSSLAAGFRRRIGGQEYCELSHDQLAEVRELVRNSSESIMDSVSYRQFLELLLQRLGINDIPPTSADQRIQALLALLQQCEGPEHSVGAFAKQLSLSGSRLSHLFKANTGISLSGYILLHKLQKAVFLIFNGANITEAALTAGFDSPSHFAAASKRLLGMAAKDIRKDSVFLKVSCLL